MLLVLSESCFSSFFPQGDFGNPAVWPPLSPGHTAAGPYVDDLVHTFPSPIRNYTQVGFREKSEKRMKVALSFKMHAFEMGREKRN